MSRFGVTTCLAIAAASVVAIELRGAERNWAVAGVWAIYLPVFTCGLVSIRMNFFCRAICHGLRDGRKIALTFDDGPDPAATPALLDLLAREKVAAAFFCIGEKVAAHPELAARIAAEGHLLANHSFRHPWYVSFLWSGPLRREIGKAQGAIQQAAGATPRFFRPPMGMTSPHFSGAMKQMELSLIGWDVRSLDTVLSPAKAIERVLGASRGGSIIVLHDGGASAAQLIEITSAVIGGLRARGFEFERLDRLLASQNKLSTNGHE
jgi:peptidoglycan-N-acetylglucosamine deacetylase